MKKALVIFALLVSLFTVPTFAQTHNHRLAIINNSSVTIWKIFISRSNTSDWEEDMLGDDVLSPGDSKYATLRGHLNYDFKSEKRNGVTCTITGIDLSVNRAIIVEDGRCYLSNQTSSTQY